MDLRTVKTLKLIRNTYIDLCRETSPLSIKVTDLSSRALINKTTFYRHYKDISELADRVEQEIFDDFWGTFAASQALLEDPESFLAELLSSAKNPNSDVSVVFKGKYDSFLGRLGVAVYSAYYDQNKSTAYNSKINFMVGGLLNALGGQFVSPEMSDEEFITIYSPFIKTLAKVDTEEVKKPKTTQNVRSHLSDKSFWNT